MQMRDVIISVTGIQHGAGGPDSLQLVTAGQYGVDQDEIRLTWEESELTGMEGTRTSITVQPRSVVLSREGALNSTMEFEEGHKHYCLFETPFGAATMGVDTRKIRRHVDENGGRVEIDYVVDMEHAVVARNKFEITIRQTGEA